MRILFLSHYFPPEVNAPASRTHEHCREWARDGDDVTVITCAPNHPAGILYSDYRNLPWQEEWVDGIRVIRLWTLLAPNRGCGRRTANYISYMLATVLAAPFLPPADVVVSTSPQFFCGLAGYGVSRIKRARWVLEIRDLWPESIRAVGAIRSPWIIRILEWLENWAYRTADKVVPVTDAFRDHIRARGVTSTKIEVIKNGVDLTLFRRRPKDERLARELRLEGKWVAAYVGTHGMAHHLQTILEAAQLLREDRRIAFLMVGDGAEQRRLTALRDRLGLENVVMLEQQPKERMPAVWSLTDVSLILLKRLDLFRTVIPSKIFEAMAMECPIILGVEGESQQIVEESGAGIAITPESAEELAGAVAGLASDPERARQLGRRGRDHVQRFYDRRALAESFGRTLASAVGDSRIRIATRAVTRPR